MLHTIQNGLLTVAINSYGAELQSIQDTSGTEYLWEGNKKFWGRRSPILFPIVGSLKEKQYIYRGTAYPMSQHGFARDMEFTLSTLEKSECWYCLEANDETKKKYPFPFKLEIGYQLSGRKLHVLWRVSNTGKEKMYFSIGAHPAFCCPLWNTSDRTTEQALKKRGEERKYYYLEFEGVQELKVSILDRECGLLLPQTEKLLLPEQGSIPQNGQIAIEEHLFDGDALVIEHCQTKKVSLCTPDKRPYLSVAFDAPLFGVWSPAANDGTIPPFICIEPWYGRCDRVEFSGELSEREWGNQLQAGEEFQADYEIEIFG